MQTNKFGVAALFAAVGVSAAFVAAPTAIADSCDPSVTVCQGGEVQPGADQSVAAPPVSAADDQYPNDGDWYFNPAGGGTALQPEHPSTGGGGGGGHH